MKKYLIVLISFIAIISCINNKNISDAYHYFTIDSVRENGEYDILIKDPDPCIDHQLMLFPNAAGTMYPESYERYIRVTFHSDSTMVKGDSVIFQKK